MVINDCPVVVHDLCVSFLCSGLIFVVTWMNVWGFTALPTLVYVIWAAEEKPGIGVTPLLFSIGLKGSLTCLLPHPTAKALRRDVIDTYDSEPLSLQNQSAGLRIARDTEGSALNALLVGQVTTMQH